MYKTLSKKAYGVWAGAAMMALGACGGLPSPPKRPVFEAFSLSSKQAPIPAPALMALPKAGASEPPLSLSASDGTGLRLVELSARAILNEPLAFTEIRLVFENPLDRTLEGTFRMVLPEGASLSRFAMKIEDRWQEGEVVERMRAREAFEDFLHRKQDPALLEQAGGNEFSARVFPIPALGRKELILSYSQELRGDVPFVLPLRGLPELGVTNIVVSSAGAEASLGELHVHDYKPEADFVVETPGEKLGSIGLRNGELMVARISPIESSSPDLITSAIILVDSSASRALGFGEQLRVLQSIIQEIARRSGPQTPISVLCFDQVVESIFEGEAGAFGEGELRRIYSRGALGASNLGAALAWASKKAEKDHAKRVIVLGDGVVTAGEMEAGEIRAKAGALAQAGIERVDAVVVGGIRHSSLLHHLTSMGLARDGVVVEGALSASELGKKLSEMSFSKLPVKVENARWAWPSTLSGIQAGDKAFVYAEVPESIKTPRISIDGRALAPLNLGRAEKPLLQRAWAKAKIDSLLDRQAKEANLEVQGQLERQIIELSTAHRVLSPYTSLLVLESEGDFERFSIERRALGDILSMDGGKFQVLKRSLPKAPKVHASKAGTVEDRSAIQLGRDENRPNVRGASSSLGSGQGRLSSVRRTVRPPSVRMGATKVSGRLPPEIIQGIIRRNFGRFRACYEQGLRASPNLSGRVTVRFVIDLSGAVSDVNLVDSASVDTKVAVCVAKAFAGLSFPQPEGGFVTVIYPILFVPPNASDPPAEQGAARFGALNKPRFQLPEQRAEQREVPPEPTPYTGRFKVVMDALAKGQAQAGLDEARAWLLASPGDIPALLALGEAFEAKGDTLEAARAYGSIIDLYASRADLRRYAGARLERLKQGAGLDLAVDSYEKAAKDRPDHPSSHRLLGFALLKKGEYQKAFEAVLRGFSRDYPSDRFAGVKGILSEDLGLIAAAWIKAEPSRREEIIDRVYGAGSALEERPSLRFVLNWETDANDVDFHIYDEEGGHAFYGQRTLGTGGMLYADVRTGYGPECFSVRLPKEERSKAYTLMAHYFSRGPMGYGMGKLQVIDHDGKGGLSFEERPFIAMEDKAYVSLGKVLR